MFISALQCDGDWDTREAKPDPQTILRICEKLKIPPKDSIMIGDNETDILAGFRAGCRATVFVKTGGWNENQLKKLLMKRAQLSPKEVGKVLVLPSIDQLPKS